MVLTLSFLFQFVKQYLGYELLKNFFLFYLLVALRIENVPFWHFFVFESLFDQAVINGFFELIAIEDNRGKNLIFWLNFPFWVVQIRKQVLLQIQFFLNPEVFLYKLIIRIDKFKV